nr:MBL fold metallo-hydrolase [Azospirillum sp. SYSU D00513]
MGVPSFRPDPWGSNILRRDGDSISCAPPRNTSPPPPPSGTRRGRGGWRHAPRPWRDALKPLLHPQLVNPPFGDPGLLVDLRFERRCLLFDLGDLEPVPARRLLRVGHAFVSHAHMDHFAGFDRLLRLCLGREKALHLFGPPGFVDNVAGKFAAYTWNLAPGYAADFAVTATALEEDGSALTAAFHSRRRFVREGERRIRFEDGVLVREEALTVRYATLDHGIPSLAYRVEEPAHVNVFKDRLEAMGLAVGPWLRALKRAVLRGDPDDRPVAAPGRDGTETVLPLGRLRAEALLVTAGQAIAYVVDTAFTPQTAARIADLARGVDVLFIESPFRAADTELAALKRHLTTGQAGRLAAMAGAKRVVPFHFSPRYQGQEEEMRREVETAFRHPM